MTVPQLQEAVLEASRGRHEIEGKFVEVKPAQSRADTGPQYRNPRGHMPPRGRMPPRGHMRPPRGHMGPRDHMSPRGRMPPRGHIRPPRGHMGPPRGHMGPRGGSNPQRPRRPPSSPGWVVVAVSVKGWVLMVKLMVMPVKMLHNRLNISALPLRYMGARPRGGGWPRSPRPERLPFQRSWTEGTVLSMRF